MCKNLSKVNFSVSNATTATKGTTSPAVTLPSQKTAPETSVEAKAEDAEGPHKMKGVLGKLKSKTKKSHTASTAAPGEYSFVGHACSRSYGLVTVNPLQVPKMRFSQSGART